MIGPAIRSRQTSAFFWVWLGVLAPLALSIPADAQTFQWLHQFGSLRTDLALGAAADSTGVYVVGRVDDALPGQVFGVGVSDAFVRKYDASGTELWTRQFGSALIPFLSSGNDVTAAVAVNGTGVYVVGQTDGVLPGQANAGGQTGGNDAFVRKYDTNGNEQWTRQFGSAGTDFASAVAADSTGIYVAGRTDRFLPGQANAGSLDAFVRKYDVNGLELWTRQYGTTGNDTAMAVAVDATGGVYVAGLTTGTLPGQIPPGGGALGDAYVRKYDGSGTEQWTRQFGTTGTDQANGVSVDATGVYVVGQTNGALQPGQANAGGYDAFVRKYDGNGTELWTSQFGSTLDDFALGTAADATGVYIGGNTNGALPGQSSLGNQDAFWRKYDSSGNAVTTSQFGSANPEQANAMAADATGVYIAGSVSGTLPGQTGAGSADAYVAKLTTLVGPTATYSDNTFLNSDWDLTVFTNLSTAGTSTANQVTSGGNPGSYRRVNISVNGLGTDATVWGFHRNLAASFDPKTRGAINFINYSEDAIFLGIGSGAGQGTGPALRQNGKVYVSGGPVTGLPASWTRLTVSGVRAADFVELIGGLAFTDPNSHPDFSATGAPIEFGFERRNSSQGQYSSSFGIDNWSVTVSLTPTPPPPDPNVSDGGVVNNASFAPSPAPISPGSIAAVFGSNLNDGSAVLFSSYGSDGKLITSLGGASAKINNIPAPMFYSTPGQLGVQIPFELAGQTSATIQVTTANKTSVARTVVLDSFAPGIFTVNQQGTGIAAVLHQDGVTPVTVQNPAHPNEVVVFFATGLGAVTPALATGAPSVGNRTVTNSVVTIDGVQAVIDFSGAAPGFVGLNQINLRIPASTRTASNIPVLVTIGGKQSNSVTIPVGP